MVCKQLPLSSTLPRSPTVLRTDWSSVAQILSRLARCEIRGPKQFLRDPGRMAGLLDTPSERHRLWQRGDGCPGARKVPLTSAEP